MENLVQEMDQSIDSGKYLPEIIDKKEINNLLLLPSEIKEKLIEDIKSGKI